MRGPMPGHIAMVITLTLFSTQMRGDEPPKDRADTIFGIVQEISAGTPGVPVCLCDGETGLPIAKETYKPIDWGSPDINPLSREMAITVTDEKGAFRFEHVPAGKYRLVAQRWIGPFKGPFEVQGTVIQLMGTANDVVVPRPADHYKALVPLTPPGTGIVEFDQEVGNDETFMFLSTSPTEFDTILGLNAMGAPFFKHLIGFNRMPAGKTTVIGVPATTVHAFFAASDSRPGAAAVEVPVSKTGFARVPAERYVAEWSNGRKTPPPKLAKLMEFLEKEALEPDELLELPPFARETFAAHLARLQELLKDLHRQIELPDGSTARVGDIFAVRSYQQFKK